MTGISPNSLNKLMVKTFKYTKLIRCGAPVLMIFLLHSTLRRMIVHMMTIRILSFSFIELSGHGPYLNNQNSYREKKKKYSNKKLKYF